MKNGRPELWLNLDTNPKAVGKGYGYRIHGQETLKYLRAVAKLNRKAKDWITICAAELYKRQKEPKHEGLFTMFEGWPLPHMYNRQLPKADYVLTPSTWVRELFRKYVPDLPPCYVVHHGIDPMFRFVKREFPKDRPFRFMWCGSTDDRKNWKGVMDAWEKSDFCGKRDYELYIKTSAPEGRLLGKNRKYGIIIDNRAVGRGALVRLYQKAHCFVFPTMGEGFGFTLAEAMRTGLPCIATGYSGHMDFFDASVGYPIPWRWGKGRATFIGGKEHAVINLAIPDPDVIAAAMKRVVREYDDALERGRRAAERIRDDYTWMKTVRKLVEIVGIEKRRRGEE